jgi:hypothetical protein
MIGRRRLFPIDGRDVYPGFGEGFPEDRCPDCERPVADHTWQHPVVMLRHAALVLLW